MADETIGSGVALDDFDTASAANDGAVLEVRSPTTGEVMYWSDGRPWTITLLGADAEKVVRIARQQADRRSQAFVRTRQPASAASVEKDSIELLVAATKGWDVPLGNGAAAKNDQAEYRNAFTKYKWLFEQANEFAGNRANFMKAK